MPISHVIIGSGIAAISAAEAIRGADPGAIVTMISAEPYPFYSRPDLPRLLSGEIPAAHLSIRTVEQIEALALERLVTHVRAIDPAGHMVTVTGGRTLGYDRLLVATVAETIPLGLPGATLKGVVQLDGARDANRMLELATAKRRRGSKSGSKSERFDWSFSAMYRPSAAAQDSPVAPLTKEIVGRVASRAASGRWSLLTADRSAIAPRHRALRPIVACWRRATRNKTSVEGVTTTPATGVATTRALTEPCCPLADAPIVVRPNPVAVTMPTALTVATDGALELQLTSEMVTNRGKTGPG